MDVQKIKTDMAVLGNETEALAREYTKFGIFVRQESEENIRGLLNEEIGGMSLELLIPIIRCNMLASLDKALAIVSENLLARARELNIKGNISGDAPPTKDANN